MSILNKENIFLLEVMVDQLKLEKKGKVDFNLINAENCIEFQFLDNDPMYICDESFRQAKSGQGARLCQGCGNVKSGNSSLFSLTSKQIDNGKKQMDLNVSVIKLLEDRKPDRVFVGKTNVSLKELFLQLLEDSDTKGVPSSKTLKEPFKLFDSNQEFAGVICLYVRMSCYGKVIVTSFQMDLLGDSIEYQGKEGNRHYKFNRKNETENVVKAGCCCVGRDALPTDVPCSLKYGLKNADDLRRYLSEGRQGRSGVSNASQLGGINGGGTSGGINEDTNGDINGAGGRYGGYPGGLNGQGNYGNNGMGGPGNYGHNGKGGPGKYGYNGNSGNNGNNGNNGRGGIYGVNGQATLSEAALAKKKADELKRKLCRDRKALFGMGGGSIMPDKFSGSAPCPCAPCAPCAPCPPCPCPCRYSCPTTPTNCC